MKFSVQELRSKIREEFVRSVPEHKFQTATHTYVEQLRELLLTYVLQNRSNTPQDRTLALNDLDKVLEQFEKDVGSKLDDVLHGLTSGE